MRMVRFVSDKEAFEAGEVVEYWEFRPGLLDTEVEDGEHPGFDFDNGELIYRDRDSTQDQWHESVQMRCSLDEARDWIKRQNGFEEIVVE